MISKAPFRSALCAAGLCLLLFFAGGMAMAAQPAPAPPPGMYTAPSGGAGNTTVQPPASVTGSALSGISELSFSWGGYFQALAVVCFILALLWFLLWLLKRHGKGGLLGGSAALRIESRLALGPKKWIMVIRYMDRRLLVGMTDENISLLADMPVENGAAEHPGSGKTGPGTTDAAPRPGKTQSGMQLDKTQPGIQPEKTQSADELFASLLHGSKDDGGAAK